VVVIAAVAIGGTIYLQSGEPDGVAACCFGP
jgi:hypothetical protein